MKTSLRALLVLMCAASLCVALPALAQDAKPDKPKQGAAQPAKKEAKKQAPKPAASADGAVSIVEAKATTGVEEREPAGSASSFSAGEKATIWMAVRNPQGPSTLKMVWFVNDIEVDTMDIDVGKSWRWRTWATRRVPRTGAWKVEVRDGDEVLETVNFTVN